MANERAMLNAKMFREFLESGEYKPIEKRIEEIFSTDSTVLKREEILQKLFDSEGKQYDADTTRQMVDSALAKLCKEGKIERIKQGHYKRV